MLYNIKEKINGKNINAELSGPCFTDQSWRNRTLQLASLSSRVVDLRLQVCLLADLWETSLVPLSDKLLLHANFTIKRQRFQTFYWNQNIVGNIKLLRIEYLSIPLKSKIGIGTSLHFINLLY